MTVDTVATRAAWAVVEVSETIKTFSKLTTTIVEDDAITTIMVTAVITVQQQIGATTVHGRLLKAVVSPMTELYRLHRGNV